jgi:hypothetical protein
MKHCRPETWVFREDRQNILHSLAGVNAQHASTNCHALRNRGSEDFELRLVTVLKAPGAIQPHLSNSRNVFDLLKQIREFAMTLMHDLWM